MKTFISLALALALFACIANAAEPLTEHREWTETYSVDSVAPRLHVSNIWGSVRIRSGKAGEITVSATESRYAASEEMFQRSMEILPLIIESDQDGVYIEVGNHDQQGRRHQNCDDCRLDIQFDIQVPPKTILDVGTVMDGRVDIDGITGLVTANNVNGPVRVDNIENCSSIESVNGTVDVGFSTSPIHDCNIGTVNGDITLGVPVNTSMDVTFDLFNGQVTSELMTGPLDTSATVEQTVRNGRNQYRIQKLSGVRLGAGGPTYSISSINGDVRIQKHQ